MPAFLKMHFSKTKSVAERLLTFKDLKIAQGVIEISSKNDFVLIMRPSRPRRRRDSSSNGRYAKYCATKIGKTFMFCHARK